MIWGENFFFTKMSDNEKSIAYNLGVNVCFYKEIFHYAVVCLDKKERRKVHCVLRFQ